MADADRELMLANVLERMDRHARHVRLAVLTAAAVEGLLMIVAVSRVNWSDNGQVLLFVLSVLSYTIIALGLFALGAHVSRVGARVVAALDRHHAA